MYVIPVLGRLRHSEFQASLCYVMPCLKRKEGRKGGREEGRKEGRDQEDGFQ
jgi:hypothetical protein